MSHQQEHAQRLALESTESFDTTWLMPSSSVAAVGSRTGRLRRRDIIHRVCCIADFWRVLWRHSPMAPDSPGPPVADRGPESIAECSGFCKAASSAGSHSRSGAPDTEIRERFIPSSSRPHADPSAVTTAPE